MKHISSFLLLSAVAALGARSYAQTLFGPWQQTGNQLFVDDNGSDTANTGLTRSSPFATISHALQVADQSFAPLPVTINVLPGTYFVGGAPLNVPAYGIALEALDDSTDATPGVWKLIGATNVDVIEVTNFFGPATIATGIPENTLILFNPPSIVLGFDIRGGNRGINVHPTVSVGVNPITTRIEIRDCEVHANKTGILVFTDTPRRSEAVIEHNKIHDNVASSKGGIPATGVGLEIDNLGVSSCLVRSNRIWDNPTNVVLGNLTSDALLSQDRLFSNFIEQGFTNIDMTDSAARIASNTIAFASNGNNTPVISINYKNTALNGVLVLLNNIIWSPNTNAANVDIAMTGTNFTTFVFNNDIEDSSSVFVGTNGNFRLPPPFVGGAAPEDLHLVPTVTSPPIWGGANPIFIRAAPNGMVPFPALMTMSVAGTNVRIDIPIDVDTDPRILKEVTEVAFTPDLGADEVRSVVLSFVANSPTTQGFDQLGNMTPLPTGTGVGSVIVQHPTGATAVLAMGPLFLASPVDTNSILDPLGNVLLEVNSSVVFVPGTTVGATTTFNLSLAGAVNFPEAEIYLQAIVTPQGGAFLGSGWLSNRLRMEIDN